MPTKIEWAEGIQKIPGYDDYCASVSGQIVSMKSGSAKALKPIVAQDGHLYVFLYNSSRPRKKM